jgi:TolB-like protein
MYTTVSSPGSLLRWGRFFCAAVLLFAALTAAHAQAKDTLAILPFTGGQGEDGETIAELFSFQRDLTALFSPVPRTSITRAIRNEQGFQMMSGMTDPDTIAALGKQLGATYVVAGTIAKLGSQNLLIIAILHTENLRQIAGDMQTYTTIEEIDGKLPAMARNIAAAVKTDTSRLPLLALPPVQLAGGADSREADALAQILAARLLQSGKYAVYPRTKSLEQVQEEYGNQFNGDTADEYLPNLGMGTNPRLVLSVTARRLGARSMFNAAVINLETGVQEAGDTVNYQSLDDGIRAMEQLALKLTNPEKAEEEEAARVRAAQEAAAEAARYNSVASDTASFTRAIAAINNDTAGGQYVITLNGSFTSNPVGFTGNATKTITIKGDASVRTISNNGDSALFVVPRGITLVLDSNVTLNGNNQKDYIVSVEGGTLVMKSGSTVRDSQSYGVIVGSGGTFTMSGGAISGNSESGVYVASGGTFTMSGGAISGNSGSGVYVDSGGTFRMSGGTISRNSDSSGGGVRMGGSSGGTFTMSGGTISGNTASYGGGGVYVASIDGGNAFTMSGGTISGNTASSGGGVYVGGGSGGGAFTMSGGTISGNTASNNGGGVYVSDGTFAKSGGGTIDSTNSAKEGKVAYTFRGEKKRNTAAGPSVNLDSSVNGRRGGWE